MSPTRSSARCACASAREADALALRLVTTLVASEIARLHAPDRASRRRPSEFLRALAARELSDSALAVAAAAELGLDLSAGATVLVVRAHAHVAGDDGWRARVLAVVERGVRGAVPGAVAALTDRHELPGDEVVVLLPTGDDGARRARGGERCGASCRRGCRATPSRVGRSRPCSEPGELHRAASEALLAANVAEGDPERPVLAFDETGAYRLLLSAMSEDPAELQRFYAETVEPLVAYDEQYETDLVTTVEAFLDADGNVAGTAQRLFTHRHTIRYRLERVRELSGLDVGSTDGREKLSLGLKAMRVLGIAHRGGPATEPGVSAGRVPRVR